MLTAQLQAMPLRGNQLLGALPAYEFNEIQANLEPVKMRKGDVLYEPGDKIDWVYFPDDSIVSQVTVFEDGGSVESGIVGREGMTGVSFLLSRTNLSRETTVQMSGTGYRIRTDKFENVLEQSGLKKLVSEYSSAFYNQVAQAGACSSHHSSHQRLARLLLMCADRTDGVRFHLTHDSIAQMLGVYRPCVTMAALEFKEQGLITYSRGDITITDRRGLELASCECYDVINECYRHYLSLLELRYLNDRADRARDDLRVEMQRREDLRDITRNGMERLSSTLAGIKGIRNHYGVCRRCSMVRETDGRWVSVNDFLETRINVAIESCTCPSCATRR
jgi:CRP-like cAMP-binding protein